MEKTGGHVGNTGQEDTKEDHEQHHASGGTVELTSDSLKQMMAGGHKQDLEHEMRLAKEAVDLIEAQFQNTIDLKYYEDFVRKFKKYEDFPEIEQANGSENFFEDNLSSGYFQWAEVRESADKVVYINRITGEQRDKNPLTDLREVIKRKKETDLNWQWVPDKKFVWIPGRFVREEGKSAIYQAADNITSKIPETAVKAAIPLDRFLLLQTTHDLISIYEGRSEAYVMYVLASRYYKGKIYTKLANRVLVSLNPYHNYPLYTEQIISKYQSSASGTLPPHLYSLSKDVLESLKNSGKSQSIVIIGESGSGKTEACKQCIKYIGHSCKGRKSGLIDLVMNTFPILEALGNAKTVKNNNSSRYGKWMEIILDSRSEIVGCALQNYLLEKSRVTTQSKGERNYHIFYYMCRGIRGEERNALFLDEIDTYSYLNQTGCTTADTINDREMYGVVKEGLKDIFGDEAFNLFELWSAVLLFGNVQVEAVIEGESSKVSNLDVVEKIGKLLRIDSKVVEDAIIKLKTEQFTRLYTKAKAIDSRNACAKTLYGRLFDYVISKINEKFKDETEAKECLKHIGILDIYGFEILESNSFEQLCINYANEKLHQHFVLHTFKMEKELYLKEGITFNETIFKDNEPIVKLLEHNVEGIFACIEDEIRMPKSSDDKLISRMHAKYSAKKDLYSKDIKNPTVFKIHHYTSPVSYKVANFLEKAKDEISWNILQMLGDSGHPILKKIFKPSHLITPDDVKGGKQNIGIQFRTEINGLLQIIEKGEPFYINCILPNRDKLPMCFDHNVVREQLKANGVLETLEICQKGFSVKINVEEFISKYKMLGAAGKKDLQIQDIVSGMKTSDQGQIKVGKNMVFLKEEDIQLLELRRKAHYDESVKKIIGIMKMYNAKKLRKRLAQYKVLFKKALEANTVEAYDEALKNAQALPFRIYEHSLCVKNREKLLAPPIIEEEVIVKESAKPPTVEEPIAEKPAEEEKAKAIEEEKMKAKEEEIKATIELLRKCLLEYVDDQVIKEGIEKAKKINVKDEALLADCEKLLEKRKDERALLEKIQAALISRAIASPHTRLSPDTAIIPLQDLVTLAGKYLPFSLKDLNDLMPSMEFLLALRKAFASSNVEELEELIRKYSVSPSGPYSQEVENAKKYIENQHEGKILTEKMKEAIALKNKDRITDLLVQGKVLRMQWNPELFKQAIETLKKISEITYYKDKARQSKNIGLIHFAIEKAESNDPNDKDIPELRSLASNIRDLFDDCLIALNVLEREQMEDVLKKAKAYEMSNEFIDMISMLLYEMDPSDFEELQFKVAMKLGDKQLIIKRTLQKKKKEFLRVPNPAESYSIEKCPILQNVKIWAKKSFISDLFGSEKEREKCFLKWTKEPIHKPISQISDKKLISKSVETFKNILSFMGDMKHENPINCAQSIIHYGIHEDLMKDEIYLQLMKQLHENGNPASVEKGWMLFGYCLKSFSPVMTQSYVEYFLRSCSKYPEQLLMIMYSKMLFEPTNILQVTEIRTMLSQPLKLEAIPPASTYLPKFSAASHPHLLNLGADLLRQLNLVRHAILMGESRKEKAE